MPRWPQRSLEERLFEKVEKTDTCWLWMGTKVRRGYGWLWVDAARGRGTAHRASWELVNGPVPAGLCVLHRCDVPACVRPDHLFLGTRTDNMRDMVAKGRRVKAVAKLTPADVANVRARAAEGVRSAELARAHGVSRRAINAVISRETWADVA